MINIYFHSNSLQLSVITEVTAKQWLSVFCLPWMCRNTTMSL